MNVRIFKECSGPREAQEFMLQQLRQYPPQTYDTSLSAVPKASKNGLEFIVIGSRKDIP